MSRDEVQPLIDELLQILAEAAPEGAAALTVQQATSRLMFEAYRRGRRNARTRPNPSVLGIPAVTGELSLEDE